MMLYHITKYTPQHGSVKLTESDSLADAVVQAAWRQACDPKGFYEVTRTVWIGSEYKARFSKIPLRMIHLKFARDAYDRASMTRGEYLKRIAQIEREYAGWK